MLRTGKAFWLRPDLRPIRSLLRTLWAQVLSTRLQLHRVAATG